MKRLMVVVQVEEAPGVPHPDDVRRRLEAAAFQIVGRHGEVIEGKVYDVRDRDPRPKEARRDRT